MLDEARKGLYASYTLTTGQAGEGHCQHRRPRAFPPLRTARAADLLQVGHARFLESPGPHNHVPFPTAGSLRLPRLSCLYSPLSPLAYIERVASVYPHRVAQIYGKRRYTWAETYRRCRRFASALRQHGIQREDTVALMLPNVPAIFEAHYAAVICSGNSGASILNLMSYLVYMEATIWPGWLEWLFLSTRTMLHSGAIVASERFSTMTDSFERWSAFPAASCADAGPERRSGKK